jgi:hypothetical protein
MPGAFYGNIAAMSTDDGQSQTQRESALGGRTAFVATVEALEDMGNVIFVDANAGIGNLDSCIACIHLNELIASVNDRCRHFAIFVEIVTALQGRFGVDANSRDGRAQLMGNIIGDLLELTQQHFDSFQHGHERDPESFPVSFQNNLFALKRAADLDQVAVAGWQGDQSDLVSISGQKKRMIRWLVCFAKSILRLPTEIVVGPSTRVVFLMRA